MAQDGGAALRRAGDRMKMNEAKRFCDEYITRRAKSALNNEADKYAENASELSG